MGGHERDRQVRPHVAPGTPRERARRIAYLPQAAEIDRTFPINVYDMVAMGLWRRAGMFGGIDRKARALIDQGEVKAAIQFDPGFSRDLARGRTAVIQVIVAYPGASPATMASAVATVLEQQFSTIAGIDNMTSSSVQGAWMFAWIIMMPHERWNRRSEKGPCSRVTWLW